jgi:hypothetical protein
MRESICIQRLCNDFVNDEQISLVLSLVACESFDSTFFGCILGIHEQLRRVNKKLIISSPSVFCSDRFHASRVNKFLNISFEPISGREDGVQIDAREIGKEDLARHVVECHRRLLALGGTEAKAYAAIVERINRAIEGS